MLVGDIEQQGRDGVCRAVRVVALQDAKDAADRLASLTARFERR